MGEGQFGQVVTHVNRLFGAGTVTGVSDSQLLVRFLAERDELAFETLVARHGPTVLSVCRRLLEDPRDVEDAFQATFLVLVRKANSIRERDLLGNWLYGVAHRVATKVRADAIRRRARERLGVEVCAQAAVREPAWDDLGLALHEEVRRLPDKYRAPIVICDLGGQTHEEAASQLHWPIGTVKGRLFRARRLLRERLTRRGLAVSSPAVIGLALSRESAAASVPPALSSSTVRAAMLLAAGKAVAGGLVPASSAALAEGIARAMLTNKLTGVAAAAIVSAGFVITGAAVFAFQQHGSSGSGIATRVQQESLDLLTNNADEATTPSPAATAESSEDKDRSRKAVAQDNAWLIAAQRAHELRLMAYKAGENTSERVLGSLRRLMEVRLALSPDVKGRIAVLGDSVGQIEDLVKVEQARLQSGSGSASEVAEVQVTLEEVKAKLRRLQSQASNPNDARSAESLHPLRDTRFMPIVEDSDDLARNEQIRELLKMPLSMPFTDPTPLADVVKYIKSATQKPEFPDGMPFYLDPHGLETVGATVDTPVTLSLEGIRLKTSLRLVLQQLSLGYFIREGLLVITDVDSDDYQAAKDAETDRIFDAGKVGNAPTRGGKRTSSRDDRVSPGEKSKAGPISGEKVQREKGAADSTNPGSRSEIPVSTLGPDHARSGDVESKTKASSK